MAWLYVFLSSCGTVAPLQIQFDGLWSYSSILKQTKIIAHKKLQYI